MNDARTFLFVDDNPAHFEEFREALIGTNDSRFQVEWVRTLADALERLRNTGIWAIVVNLVLPDSQGLVTLDKLLEAAPTVPILVLTGTDHKNIAKEALQRGAKDYLREGHIDAYSFDRAIRNMAEREAAQEALFAEKERAQVTLNSIGDAVLSTDISGNISYLNTVAETMTGWTCKEALGKPLAEVFHIIDGDTREPSPNPMELAVQRNKTVGLTANCILVRRDGKELSIEDSAAPIHDRCGLVTGAVIVFHDISVSKAMVTQMSRLAHHDSLTGLPNRLLLKDRVGRAIATAHRNSTQLAVLFLDLDGFKHINDSLGHAVGDSLLRSVSSRLVSTMRGTDTVGRQGGDEYVVLLTEIKKATDAGIGAKKIITALALPHKLISHWTHSRAS